MSEPSRNENASKLQENVAPQAQPCEDVLPRRFGRLTLLRRLARGGMGEVYLASTGGIEGAERPCVVKIIRREHASDRSFRARFLDETRIQAQLQHPGVAQILEAATTEDDCPYAVVEYVEGRHLGEVLTRSAQLGLRISWEDSVAVAIAFGDALAHVHERTDASGRPLEIAHRDLSPQNVMVGYAGDLKLIDFGTARGENRRCRTVSGIVFAKPGYVAPEVANQTPGGAAADLYAFGVMFWELLAGRRFLQGDPVEHQGRVARGELSPAPLAAELGAPAELDAVIARLTATNVADRYPTARAAVAELVTLLKSASSLANGDRSVRGRIAHLMQRLYPAEPARSRADFARRAAQARQLAPKEHGVPAPSPEPPQAEDESGLLPGTRYRLVRRLGAGAMGEVYEATHVDLGRAVAVKVLPREAAGSAERRHRFRTEARAIARLDHPSLVKLHDFGVTADGRFYYAMELLEGESLDRRLRRGPLPWREGVRIASAACQALEAAHGAGVIHRDITPSNLFLTTSGVVKLLDFGVARNVRDPRGEGEVGSVFGTPEYLAPEQAAGAEADERADIYSLGAVLYEMVTGMPPHWLGPGAGADVAQLLTAKISTTPLAPRVCAPDRELPRWLDELIVKTLSREPSRRFASAALLRAALESPAADRSRWRGRVGVGLGVACAAAAAAFAWTTFHGEGGAAPSPWHAEPLELSALGATPPGDDDASTVPSSQEDPTTLAPVELVSSEAVEPENAAVAADGAHDSRPMDSARESESPTPEKVTDKVATRVAESLALVQRGQRIKGYNRLKALALRHPERADVQRGWSLASVAVKAWGDALRAAHNWVALEPSPAARLHLAKMEKATVRGDAVKTLELLLEADPTHGEARRLLEEYQRDRIARR